MEPGELAFYSTEELVSELLKRTTFLGVVVHTEEDWKGDDWGEERTFKVRFNSNLETAEASRLLGRVAEYLNLHCC
ncbi:MAG TPA: hypothetical protein VFB96_19610 [Pirellulaceae bacterium]|nr:hypothetical protein [Pirellulaceae bacterium]